MLVREPNPGSRCARAPNCGFRSPDDNVDNSAAPVSPGELVCGRKVRPQTGGGGGCGGQFQRHKSSHPNNLSPRKHRPSKLAAQMRETKTAKVYLGSLVSLLSASTKINIACKLIVIIITCATNFSVFSLIDYATTTTTTTNPLNSKLFSSIRAAARVDALDHIRHIQFIFIVVYLYLRPTALLVHFRRNSLLSIGHRRPNFSSGYHNRMIYKL